MQLSPSLFTWKPQWKQSNHKNHTNLFWCQVRPQFDYVSGEKIKYNQTTGEEVEGFAAGKWDWWHRQKPPWFEAFWSDGAAMFHPNSGLPGSWLDRIRMMPFWNAEETFPSIISSGHEQNQPRKGVRMCMPYRPWIYEPSREWTCELFCYHPKSWGKSLWLAGDNLRWTNVHTHS